MFGEMDIVFVWTYNFLNVPNQLIKKTGTSNFTSSFFLGASQHLYKRLTL
jgi:hypothetical protein